MLKSKLQFPSIFSSNTPITKQRLKNLQSVLFALQNHPDSEEFREPLNYKQRGLINYDFIVKNPMDISTVRKMLKNDLFQYCEECLDFTQTIFENSLLYNQKTQWILALTKRCELVFHKLVKNHLPEVVIKGYTEGKKIQKKNKQLQKNVQKIKNCLTDVDSLAETSTQRQFHKIKTQIITNSQEEFTKSQSSIKSQKKPQIVKALFELIHEASQKSLEVLYIMTKNENMGAISTERNGTFKIKVGNCAIDIQKLSNTFIVKAIAFLKNQIQRVRQLENKEKKKKPKGKYEAGLDRYQI